MKQWNKNFRRILTITAVAAMLVTTAAAASTATKKMIEASYSGIKLVVNGVEVTPKDPNGKVVEPFISDGTTYLPLRALCNAMGYSNDQILWDGETKTIYVGDIPGAEENWMIKVPVYQLDHAKLYDGSDRKATFDVAGKTQTLGVTFSAWYDPSFAIWNTNGEYKTMNLTIGHMGNKTQNAVMEVYLDGEYSTEYELKYDAAPKTLSIPLNYAPNVKLNFIASDGGRMDGAWGIYDISFS